MGGIGFLHVFTTLQGFLTINESLSPGIFWWPLRFPGISLLWHESLLIYLPTRHYEKQCQQWQGENSPRILWPKLWPPMFSFTCFSLDLGQYQWIIQESQKEPFLKGWTSNIPAIPQPFLMIFSGFTNSLMMGLDLSLLRFSETIMLKRWLKGGSEDEGASSHARNGLFNGSTYGLSWNIPSRNGWWLGVPYFKDMIWFMTISQHAVTGIFGNRRQQNSQIPRSTGVGQNEALMNF